VNARPWKNSFPSEINPWVEPRDFGRLNLPGAYFYVDESLGVHIRAGMTRGVWGFRKYPFARAFRLMFGYSTDRGRGEVNYSDIFCFANSSLCAESKIKVSGVDSVNFFGFGNETVKDDDRDDAGFYEVSEDLYRLSQTVNWRPIPGFEVYSGLELQYTEEDSSNTLIGESMPYGSGDFGQLGLILGVEWDTRASAQTLLNAARISREKKERMEAARLTGIGFEARGSLFPKVWDVDDTFGALEGELTGSLALGTARLVLAGKVGGRKVWGDFPWHQAAFIGGSDSNRGFTRQRFAGERAAYGGAELRLRVFDGGVVLPTRTWVFALVDVGRVWADGDDSDEWHPSYGGGLLLGLRATPMKFRVEVAKNDDEDSLKFYLATGFAF
jgi:hypothetical protein